MMLLLLPLSLCTGASAHPSSETADTGLTRAPLALADLRLTGLEKEGSFLGHSAPEFRWSLRCDGCHSVRQTTYRITVHDEEAQRAEPLWDTGDVLEGRLRHATATATNPYETLPLLGSNRQYRWKLAVSAVVNGQSETVSAVASSQFRTALLRTSDWDAATWIGGGTALRTEFKLVGSTVASAQAFVSAAGCFDLSVNGQKAAPGVFLEPSWASFPPVRMLYRAYDIASFLSAGSSNAVGLRLGMCKYGYNDGFCDGAHAATAACKAAIVHISVKFTDGSSFNVSSSANGTAWMATTANNPVTYSHLFHGEIYDTRLEEDGWDQPGFKPASGWERVVAYSGAAAQFGQLSLAQYPSVAIVESHKPVSIKPVKVAPPPSGLRGCPINEIGVAGSGTVILQCPDDKIIEEITFATFGIPESSGRWIQGNVGDHCADRKYVPGCIFWEDIARKTKYFARSCVTPPCGANACKEFTPVGSYVTTLADGGDFTCDVMPNCTMAAGSCASVGDVAKSNVSKLCVGKASCSIPATPAFFGGDPCPTVKAPKSIAVRARCSNSKPTTAQTYVFDFGQNMAGFATLNVTGVAPGTEITLRYGEVLNKDGSVKMAWCGEPCNVGPGSFNTANQTDKYIAKGGPEPEVFTPHFTYHGYRYVQVEGLPTKPDTGVLTGHFVHTNVTKDGHVEFKKPSMQILNGIQKAIVYTQLSNFYHHPTDCPQR